MTGSSDKNIKIWGLDFGDCHRSIFAHDDSIMCVQVRLQGGVRDVSIVWTIVECCEMCVSVHMSTPDVMQFVPDTHLVFSASKDKTLKCWDADKFELITTLEVAACDATSQPTKLSQYSSPSHPCHSYTSSSPASLHRATKEKFGAWLSVTMETQW